MRMVGSAVPFVLPLLPQPDPTVTLVAIGGSTVARWTFGSNVTVLDSFGGTDLHVAGQSGVALVQATTNEVDVAYPGPIGIGDLWEVAGTNTGLFPTPAVGQTGVAA